MAKSAKDGSRRTTERAKAVAANAGTSRSGGKVHERTAVVRQLISLGWSGIRVKERLSKEWGVAPRTIESYLAVVRDEVWREFNGDRRSVFSDLMLRMEKHYAEAMKAGNHSAAGIYHDRIMKLFAMEAPRRVELTGKDGGPVETLRKVDLTGASKADLETLARVIGLEPEEEG